MGNTRKANIRHAWSKSGSGFQKCNICGVTKRTEYRDGKKTNCVYLASGDLYSMTGATPPCKDLGEFYD